MEGAVRPHILDRLPALVLALALVLPLASLPWFSFGYWDKAEPMVAGFHAGAALAWVAVALAGRARSPAVWHPFVLLPALLGLWSLAAAPFTDLPWLSVFGAPQSGFGALWFFDFAGYCACALLAIRQPDAWLWLVRWAAVVTLAVAGLKARDWFSLRQQGDTLLLFVPSYYGWLGLALAPLAATLTRRADRIVLVAVAALVALASTSLTAVALLFFGLVYTGIAHWGGTIGWVARVLASRPATAAWVALAAFLPWVLLQTVPWLRLKESLRDRWLVWRMVESALFADPRLVFGHGWGRTQDAFHTWLNATGERLWNSDWIFLSSDYFHSHNWALESLYAAGAPGFLLTLAGFVALPWWAAPGRRAIAAALAVAIALFHGVWFQLCLSLPLMAMAYAGVAGEVAWNARSWLVRFAAPVAATASAAASAALICFGLRIAATDAGWSSVPPSIGGPPGDFRQSDLAAAELIRDTLVKFADRARAEPVEHLSAALDPMLDFIDQRAERTTSILLLTTGLTAMAQIHVSGDLAFAAQPRQILMWRRWLTRLLVLAPGRTDLAIPYLTLAISAGRWDEVSGFSSRVLQHNQDDPVGLHYGGLALLAQGGEAGRAAGLAMVRRGIENGVERFIPLDPALKRALGISS